MRTFDNKVVTNGKTLNSYLKIIVKNATLCLYHSLNELVVPCLPLNKHHIDIYLVRPEEIDLSLQADFKTLISPSEQQGLERKRSQIAKRDALITRVFVRLILSRYASIKPNDWTFDKGWNGKPFIASSCQGHNTNIEFNLSHATGLIACAVTKSLPLGLDVEYTRRNSDTYKLAPRYFSQTEVDDLHALPYADQAIGFYNYWTLKESYIKACGDGLSIPLHHFSFDLHNRDNIALSFDDARDDNPHDWHCQLFDVTNDHKMALTAKIEKSGKREQGTHVKKAPVSTTIYKMMHNGEFEVTSLPLTTSVL